MNTFPLNNSVSPKCKTNRISVKIVLLLSIVFGALCFIISNKGIFNPDYDSYKKLFDSVSHQSSFRWEPLFLYLNYVFKYYHLSYDQFRSVILFLSLTNFTAAVYIFLRKLRSDEFQCQKQSIVFETLVGLAFTFALAVFFFEFFVIRIRAGFAISIVLLAFSLFWPDKNKSHWLNLLLITILLAMAFASHKQTTILLVFYFFYPLILSILYSKDWFSREGLLRSCFSFCSIAIPAFLLVYAILKMSSSRGPLMFSKLNVFRLIALSVIPLAIAALGLLVKKYIALTDIVKPQSSNTQTHSSVPTQKHQLLQWHYFITYTYISMALGLLYFYMTGSVDQYGAGEAIVRLFTVNSSLAVFVVLSATGFYRLFWLFILTSNSLFFFNAVFLSSL